MRHYTGRTAAISVEQSILNPIQSIQSERNIPFIVAQCNAKQKLLSEPAQDNSLNILISGEKTQFFQTGTINAFVIKMHFYLPAGQKKKSTTVY